MNERQSRASASEIVDLLLKHIASVSPFTFWGVGSCRVGGIVSVADSLFRPNLEQRDRASRGPINVKTSEGNAMETQLAFANQGEECMMIRNTIRLLAHHLQINDNGFIEIILKTLEHAIRTTVKTFVYGKSKSRPRGKFG